MNKEFGEMKHIHAHESNTRRVVTEGSTPTVARWLGLGLGLDDPRLDETLDETNTHPHESNTRRVVTEGSTPTVARRLVVQHGMVRECWPR